MILSYPEIRDFVAKAFSDLISAKYPSTESISGVATGGIAQGALVANNLNLPMTYVRSGAKKHGRQNQVEGVCTLDQKVVVIEDLVSTGGSSLQAVDALREKGVSVEAMLAIFTYEFDVSVQAMKAANVPFTSLSSYSYLIEEAQKLGYVSSEEMASLMEWKKNPSEWQG